LRHIKILRRGATREPVERASSQLATPINGKHREQLPVNPSPDEYTVLVETNGQRPDSSGIDLISIFHIFRHRYAKLKIMHGQRSLGRAAPQI